MILIVLGVFLVIFGLIGFIVVATGGQASLPAYIIIFLLGAGLIFWGMLRRKKRNKPSMKTDGIAAPASANTLTKEQETPNELFDKPGTEQHAATGQEKPPWGLLGEKIIRDLSEYVINENASYIYITNARIVERIRPDVRLQGLPTPETFFRFVDLSDIRHVRPLANTRKLVLELTGGETITYSAGLKNLHAAQDMHMYLRMALEEMIPVVTFEDPHEIILYKHDNAYWYDAFCSPSLWEQIFGKTNQYVSARFCVTNKRLMYYRVEQVAFRGGDYYSVSYNITRPSISCIWLPLSGITGVFRKTYLHIRNCAPLGEIGLTQVIPAIDRKRYPGIYDSERSKALGGAEDTIKFNHFHQLAKKDLEGFEVIKRTIPGAATLE